MLKHILPQQVVLLVAGICQFSCPGERQVAVSVQTDGDSQGISRQITLKRIAVIVKEDVAFSKQLFL